MRMPMPAVYWYWERLSASRSTTPAGGTTKVVVRGQRLSVPRQEQYLGVSGPDDHALARQATTQGEEAGQESRPVSAVSRAAQYRDHNQGPGTVLRATAGTPRRPRLRTNPSAWDDAAPRMNAGGGRSRSLPSRAASH